MGYQTDFVGYLHVQPALNEAEIEFVNRIHRVHYESQRGGLRAIDEGAGATLALLASAPRGWSNWAACGEGCCLSYDGGDKANHMIRWLKYLMATYLVPGADAAGRPGFEEFTCDHFLNGMVVGSRRDNRELYSITARDNEVEVELLWPGVPEWSDYPALRYQDEIDRFREWLTAYRLEESRAKVRRRRAEIERGWDGDV